MKLQDIITKECAESLDKIRIKLRTTKARELFSRLRKKVKADNLLVVSHRGKIKKVFYGGRWYRPVIINDKLCLLGNGESINYIS